MKYILYIDYKANGGTLEFRPMEATNLEDAILETEEIHDDTMYLIRICEKVEKVYKEYDYKVQDYKARLCKRTKWHKNDEENGERDCYLKRCYNKNTDWIEIK